MTWDPNMMSRWGGGFQPGGITGGPGQNGQVDLPAPPVPGAATGGMQSPGAMGGPPGMRPWGGGGTHPWDMPPGAPGAPGAANGGAPPPGTGTAPLPWTHGAGGGMPSLQDFWSRIQAAGGQVHDGLQNARANFRDGLINRLGQLPQAFGMQPRPGGTAGGGWAFPQGGFQMPQGFAAHLPWGHWGGGGPGGSVPPGAQGVAQGEPHGAFGPGAYGMNNTNNGARDAINRLAAQNNAAGGAAPSGGSTGFVPRDPAARAEMDRKAHEIGKKAKGY